MEVFEISAEKLAALYPELKCDGCGRKLSANDEGTWVKAGCGYFCPDCVARQRHLGHPAAGRAT